MNQLSAQINAIADASEKAGASPSGFHVRNTQVLNKINLRGDGASVATCTQTEIQA